MKTVIAPHYSNIGSSGSQRIQSVWVEGGRVCIELDYGYDVGMSKEDAQKLIDLLTQAVQYAG